MFTVTLSAMSGRDVTVNVATSNLTATAGTDYTATTMTPLTISAGATTAPFSVPVGNDSLDEFDETFRATLSGPVNATIADSRGDATITNDDSANAATVSIVANPAFVTEGGLASFTISLSQASGKTISVRATTTNGTATAGSGDFTNPGNQTFTFVEGGATTDTYTVQTTDDSNDESDSVNETFSVTLSNFVNTSISGTNPAVGEIADNDADNTSLGLSISDVTGTESGVNQTYTFQVTLSGTSFQPVTVDVATANGPAGPNQAVQPTDYTQKATVGLTFTPGQTSKNFTVTVKGDSVPELSEVFNVNLSNPVGANIADGQGDGTINNDDAGVTTGLVISEFRFRGPGGPLDEFIEVTNKTASPITVFTASPSTGFAVAKSGGVVLFTIPNGTTIPPLGHFLGANIPGAGNYSLSTYGGTPAATADATWTGDIDESSTPGIALFPDSTILTSEMDAVGFAGAAAGYFEGTPIPATSMATLNGEFTYVRKNNGGDYDTGDNSADFVFASTTSGTFGAAVTSVLGSPGPQNASSPIVRNGSIAATRLDTGVAATASPNLESTGPATGAAPGYNLPANCGGAAPVLGVHNGFSYCKYLTFRSTYTNNTGSTVTKLRFRIVNMTTLNSPNTTAACQVSGYPQADLRFADSPFEPAVVISPGGGGGTMPSEAVTIDLSGAGFSGGMYSSGTATAVVSLPDTQSVNISLRAAVYSGGCYNFFVNVEAIP